MTVTQVWSYQPNPYDVVQESMFEATLAWHAPTEDAEEQKAFIRNAAHSQYGRLLSGMFAAAKEYATSKGMTVDEFKCPMTQAAQLCRELGLSCIPEKDAYKTHLRFLPEQTIRLNAVENYEGASYCRDAIEPLVGKYLRLPFRAPEMERALAGLLMWHEASNYAALTFNYTKGLFGFLLRAPFRPQVLLTTLISIGGCTLVLGGIAFLADFMQLRAKMSSGWAEGTILVSLGLLAVYVVPSVICLPFAWRRQNRARKRASNLMLAMADAYNPLSSSGPVSANRVHDLVTKAADTGVVWPASLFALLDDIKKRDGRF